MMYRVCKFWGIVGNVSPQWLNLYVFDTSVRAQNNDMPSLPKFLVNGIEVQDAIQIDVCEPNTGQNMVLTKPKQWDVQRRPLITASNRKHGHSLYWPKQRGVNFKRRT